MNFQQKCRFDCPRTSYSKIIFRCHICTIEKKKKMFNSVQHLFWNSSFDGTFTEGRNAFKKRIELIRGFMLLRNIAIACYDILLTVGFWLKTLRILSAYQFQKCIWILRNYFWFKHFWEDIIFVDFGNFSWNLGLLTCC